MDKNQKRKDMVLPIIIGSIIVAIFIFAIWQFLGTKDCYGLMGGPQTCITGWETLKLEWPSFWTWITICSIAGGLCVVVAVYNDSGAGKLGRWLRGYDGVTWTLLIIALLLFTCPWGKACTDKSNGGITAPGHKVENKAP